MSQPSTPRPSAPPPPPPRPAGPSTPTPPTGPRIPALRLAIALVVVGVLLLTLHYFVPYLLLAALPVKEWRRAAIKSTYVSLGSSPIQRHHPAAVGAGTGAAVGGTASGSPLYSPARPASGVVVPG